MRVGIVIDDLNRHRGGMSEWSCQFVSAAAKRGIELHIVSQGFGNDPLPESVSCHTIERTRSRQVFAESAKKLLERLKFDVVHDMGLGWHFDVFQPHGGSFEAWNQRRLNMYPRWFRALKRPVDRLLPRQRDFHAHGRRQFEAIANSDSAVIAISQMVADDFIKLHRVRPDRIELIHNGVDCRRFSPEHRAQHRASVRQRLGVEDDTLLLLIAAHNYRLKGLPELLRATARLIANGQRTHLAVAGGKRVAKWQRVAQNLKMAEQVTFLGTVGNMVPYYAAADAYVHPTYYDPCSLVILEAAASGLAIVTTRRFNGAVELFGDGREILTIADPSAEDALYERIEELYDVGLRTKLGDAARLVALQNPIDRNVTKLLQVYESRARHRRAA